MKPRIAFVLTIIVTRSPWLTDYRSLPMYVRYPEWALTGDKIVYEFNESKGNVYLAGLR